MKRLAPYLFIFLLSISLTACGLASAQALPSAVPPQQPTTAVQLAPIDPSAPAAPADDSYKNATYEIEGKPVTLANGMAEAEIAPGSAAKIVTRYFGNEAVGDLNGDGKEDVAFLLTHDGGGSGTFYYAVVALQTESGYQGTNGIFLGDRIAPQSTFIQDGAVTFAYAGRKPDEPFTAQPSVGVSKTLKVVDGLLVEVE